MLTFTCYMRKAGKITLIVFGSLVGLLLLLALLLVVFENDIKRYAVNSLNEKLNTRIEVEAIELSIWDRFPNASLRFKNIAVKDAWSTGVGHDTLFFAERLYLEFNLSDLITGDYTIKEISTKNGFLDVRITAEGDGNFHVFKPTEKDDKGGDDLAFNLSRVHLENIRLKYNNEVNEERYEVMLHDAEASGAFKGSEFTVNNRCQFTIEQIRSGKIKMLSGVFGTLNTTLDIKQDGALIILGASELLLGKVPFAFSGEIISDSLTHCNLMVSATKSSIGDLFSLLPEHTQKHLSQYNSKGQFAFEGSIEGPVTAVLMPRLNAQFSIADASLIEPESNTRLSAINLNGTYTNRNSSGREDLVLKSLSARIDEGGISGELTCTDFTNPRLRGSLQANLDLRKTAKLLGKLPGEIRGGQLDLKTTFDVMVAELERDPAAAMAHAELSAGIRNAELVAQHGKLVLSNVSTDIMLRKQHAIIKNLKGKINNESFEVDGALQDFIPALISTKNALNLVASVGISKLDVDFWSDVLSTGGSTTASDSESKNNPFNANLEFNTPVLTAKDFTARKVKTRIILLNNVLSFEQLSLQAADGNIKAKAQIDMRSASKPTFQLNANLNGIKLDELFKQFNNFKQDYITNEHLKGKLTAQVDISGNFDSNYEIVIPSVKALFKFRIDNGSLTNLPAFNDIVTEMHKMKAADIFFKKHVNDMERRLKTVTFGTLENEIIIHNQQIIIPKMEIASSALNLNLSGVHHLDDRIDYHFDFMFKDLKVQKDEYTEFGKVHDDGSGVRLFIKMTGTASDPIIAFDKNEQKRARQEKLQDEKQNVKSLLKEEFGLFKKDSTLKPQQTVTREAEFILYEGDPDEGAQPNKTRDKKPKDNKTRVNKLFDKWEKEGEKKETSTFEIDE